MKKIFTKKHKSILVNLRHTNAYPSNSREGKSFKKWFVFLSSFPGEFSIMSAFGTKSSQAVKLSLLSKLANGAHSSDFVE